MIMNLTRAALVVTIIALSGATAVSAQDVSYYDVPKGDGPHDVAPAPDGTVWYTGQRAGVLGRLDPKTGKVDRIKLGDESAPHGVIVGPDGAPWVTDGGLNAILRVDPGTREIKRWSLPPKNVEQTSIRLPSTAKVAFGSRARAALWVGSIQRPAR